MQKYSEISHQSLDVDVHRQWLDAYLLHVNQNLAEDPLWLGRFRLNRVFSFLDIFEDRSGAVLTAYIRIFDLKTRKHKDYVGDCYDIPTHMFRWLNEFICEYIGVWKHEKPYDEKQDYRGIKRPLTNRVSKSFENLKK